MKTVIFFVWTVLGARLTDREVEEDVTVRLVIERLACSVGIREIVGMAAVLGLGIYVSHWTELVRLMSCIGYSENLLLAALDGTHDKLFMTSLAQCVVHLASGWRLQKYP
eukprot:943167-Amphidinium_carterae.1